MIIKPIATKTSLFFLVYILMYGSALAGETFHNGGIGRCEGCHGRSHSTENDQAPSPYMLKGADSSSTCLTCHEASPVGWQQGNHQVASSDRMIPSGVAPAQLTPGGDFGWLKKNYRWTVADARGEQSSKGESHGHNIIAAGFGFSADSRHPLAPGGNYPSQSLSCSSCHDPHGDYKRYAGAIVLERGVAAGGSGSYSSSPLPSATKAVGTYRLLAGKGYIQKSTAGTPFVSDPPSAVSPVNYNRAETASDTRVAYGAGMSEWCQNCHPQIHGIVGGGSIGHPVGKSARFTGEIIANYNSYIASGNLNGSPSSSYSSLVPFEMGTDDYASLKAVANSDGSNRKGADGESRVMCLSCHRAHASGWDSATRWNMQSEFIVHNGKFPGNDNYVSSEYAQGRTSQEVKKTFYDA